MNNLKALRESLNLKQSDVAAAVGLPKTTYSNYETGARDPKPDFWVDVAEQYQVTTDYLLGMVSDPHGTKYGGATKLDASYNALDEHGRRLVDKVINEKKPPRGET